MIYDKSNQEHIDPTNIKYYDDFKKVLQIPITISKADKAHYAGQEIGLEGDTVYTVHKTADSFTPETIKSFENVPLVIGHPKDFNNPATSIEWDTKSHQIVGTVRDVHLDGDYLKGVAVITDKNNIDMILKGTYKEVSAGYAFGLDKISDGYKMTNITGHHVALVKSGRMGNNMKIGDSMTTTPQAETVEPVTTDQPTTAPQAETVEPVTTDQPTTAPTIEEQNQELQRKVEEYKKYAEALKYKNQKLEESNQQLQQHQEKLSLKVEHPALVFDDSDTVTTLKAKLVNQYEPKLSLDTLTQIGSDALNSIYTNLKNAGAFEQPERPSTVATVGDSAPVFEVPLINNNLNNVDNLPNGATVIKFK